MLLTTPLSRHTSFFDYYAIIFAFAASIFDSCRFSPLFLLHTLFAIDAAFAIIDFATPLFAMLCCHDIMPYVDVIDYDAAAFSLMFIAAAAFADIDFVTLYQVTPPRRHAVIFRKAPMLIRFFSLHYATSSRRIIRHQDAASVTTATLRCFRRVLYASRHFSLRQLMLPRYCHARYRCHYAMICHADADATPPLFAMLIDDYFAAAITPCCRRRSPPLSPFAFDAFLLFFVFFLLSPLFADAPPPLMIRCRYCPLFASVAATRCCCHTYADAIMLFSP